MLVTALEANSETCQNGNQRLLHEERKIKEKGAGEDHPGRKALN